MVRFRDPVHATEPTAAPRMGGAGVRMGGAGARMDDAVILARFRRKSLSVSGGGTWRQRSKDAKRRGSERTAVMAGV